MSSTLTRNLGVIAVLLGMSVAVADDHKIPIEKLPAAVVNSIKARFPDAKLLSAEKDTENGRFVYEVKIRTGDMKKEVDVTPEGRIVDVDDEDD